jgi:hypothetical protein
MNRAMQKTIIQEQLSVYLAASAARKTASLDHVCFTSGMQRKAAIRAFAREQHRSGWKAPPRLGRPRLYTAETEAALAFVWEQYDYPSGELLHGAIAEAIRIFIRDDMWPYSAAATQQLRDT